jgi:hypothetical protein
VVAVQLTFCPTVCVEGLNKATKNLSGESLWSGRDSMRAAAEQAVTLTPSRSAREQSKNAKRRTAKQIHDSGRFISGTHRTGDRVGLRVGLDAVRDGGRTLQPSSPWPGHCLVTAPTGISRLRARRSSGFAQRYRCSLVFGMCLVRIWLGLSVGFLRVCRQIRWRRHTGRVTDRCVT